MSRTRLASRVCPNSFHAWLVAGGSDCSSDCPASLAGRPVIVLDPMVATGGSLLHCLRLLADRGADDLTVVCALAAPEGVQLLEQSGLPVRLFTASVDERLNENAYIVPGLGDAGDRQFGPR